MGRGEVRCENRDDETKRSLRWVDTKDERREVQRLDFMIERGPSMFIQKLSRM